MEQLILSYKRAGVCKHSYVFLGGRRPSYLDAIIPCSLSLYIMTVALVSRPNGQTEGR